MPQGLNRYLLPAAGLLATFLVSGVIVFAVASFFLGGSDGEDTLASTPSVTRTSEVTAPSTPTLTRTADSTSTPTPMSTPTPTASPTPAFPVAPTPPPPTATPAATQPPQVNPLPSSFAGTWRVVDAVLQGRGAGQTFSFQVTITQTGNTIQGGAPGAIAIFGTVAGNVATVEFSQPGLAITGIFIWSLHADGNATGTFTSSVPNSGTSDLIRLR